jgi:hypothetical protein
MLTSPETDHDIIGEYVEHAAKTVAALTREQPMLVSREQAIGRFQIENDVIWSPEIYHRVTAVLDRLLLTPFTIQGGVD